MPYTTIKKPDDYFNTVTYSGNNTSQSLTVGFQPDLVWTKSRNTSGTQHNLIDSVRGVLKTLQSNNTNTEATLNGSLTSFDTDGYSIGGTGDFNYTGRTYVGWSWLGANGTASNTDGSITSTVSANTTSGFSIVSYTGTGSNATVGHGLGAVPKMIIVKNRTGSGWSWYVYHTSLGATKNLYFNNTDAPVTDSTRWNDTAPTSSVFTIGTNGGVNESSQNLIAYCFAEKQGFSKFGSYTGNGSTDGTFVYTGFKPALVILKRTDTAGTDWNLVDNKRAGYNPDNYFIAPNSDGAENTVDDIIDLLSNGFKLKSASGASNTSGGTYIYMAFAEEPLVGDNPATAR